jgi:hypothetical protein
VNNRCGLFIVQNPGSSDVSAGRGSTHERSKKKENKKMLHVVRIAFCLIASATPFLLAPHPSAFHQAARRDIRARSNQNKDGGDTEQNTNRGVVGLFRDPIKEIGDMISNFDDIIDDFMFKRMGNGEVFYGKRKYKPSGRPNTAGRYNGMGISDKVKIEMAREIREERMLEKLRREKNEKRQQ